MPTSTAGRSRRTATTPSPSCTRAPSSCPATASTTTATPAARTRRWAASPGRCGPGARRSAPGRAPSATSTSPKSVSLGQPVRAIESTHAGGFAVLEDRTVRSWGQNFDGSVGDGSYDVRRSPVVVPGLSQVKEIAADELVGARAAHQRHRRRVGQQRQPAARRRQHRREPAVPRGRPRTRRHAADRHHLGRGRRDHVVRRHLRRPGPQLGCRALRRHGVGRPACTRHQRRRHEPAVRHRCRAGRLRRRRRRAGPQGRRLGVVVQLATPRSTAAPGSATPR